MSKTNQYVVMWDCYGLESVAQVPDPAQATFAVLQGKKPAQLPNINMWALRARFNTQRHYEIYVISTEQNISENDIREMFEADPQKAADTIRRLGHKFYSDRASQRPAIQ
jgi:hypothetical protein